MAVRKRKVSPKKQEAVFEEEFLDRDIGEILDENMSRYSEEVILRRAFPDIRDGQKPVHRRIMYVMYTKKAMSKAPYQKVTGLTGDVMSRLHPHGDSSIEDALTGLSKPWTQRVPLISIEGNNGSIDSANDRPAAGRYIEARGTKEAELLFEGIKYNNVVPFSLNYKEDEKEPDVLPARWPVLFTNGAFSIGVGIASNIPPHNTAELLQAAIYLNKHEGATLKKLMQYVPAPDFPTGGLIVKDDRIEEMYATGNGKIVVRGEVKVEKNKLVITSIPYGLTKDVLLMSIAQAAEKAKIEDQFDSIDDYSTGDLETEIHVNLRRGVDAKMIEQFLYSKTKLQITFNANNYAIVDNRPQLVTLRDYIDNFVRFRRECIRNTAQAKIDKDAPRLHLVEGFIRMTDFPDEIIQEIKKSEGKADAIYKLQDVFKFSEAQANAIATMQLYKISRQDVKQLKDEEKALKDEIAANQEIVDSDEVLIKKTDEELKDTLKDFKGDKRRTSIVDEDELEEVEIVETQLKKAMPTTIAITPTSAQRMTKAMFDNGKDKAVDKIVSVHEASTTDAVIMFTKNGLAMQRIAEDLNHVSIRSAVDSLVKSVTSFTAKDEIIAATVFPSEWAITESKELDKKIVLSVTKLGQVKKNPLSDVLLSFKQKGYMSRAKSYNGLKLQKQGDEVIFVAVVDEDKLEDLTMSLKRKSGGRVSKVSFAEISSQGATGSGINALKINKPNDHVIISTTNIDKVAENYYLKES